MILYHGSNTMVDAIDLSYSNPFKDFGRAFYLSPDREQAQRLAEVKAIKSGGTAVVSSFEFDEQLLTSSALKVKTFDGYSQEWAEFIYSNRDEQQSFAHPFDVVYGPIADDYIGLQIINYKRQYITFKEFLRKIKYHKGVTFQYAFCTQTATNHLRRV